MNGLLLLFCRFLTKNLHLNLWPQQRLSTMIVLILNINVHMVWTICIMEPVVRLLMEHLVVAHMNVRKFQEEIVVFSFFQKNNTVIFTLAPKKMVKFEKGTFLHIWLTRAMIVKCCYRRNNTSHKKVVNALRDNMSMVIFVLWVCGGC